MSRGVLAEVYAQRAAIRGITEDEAVAIAESAQDRLPTIDQVDSDKPPPADYRDWTPEQTRVVTYTNDPEVYPRDRVAETMAEARAQCELTFGRILEVNAVPGRWFFRVMRQVKEVTP